MISNVSGRLRRLPLAAGLALALAAGPAAPGAGAEEAWHTMTGPERSFTAELPAAPKYTPVKMRTAAGTGYTIHQYVLERGDTVFSVQLSDFPSDVNLSNARLSLQNGLDVSAKALEGGKWASVDWTTLQGWTAVDAVGVKGGFAVRSFSVAKGQRLVTLTYAGPAGSARSDAANRFIGSLRLGP